MPRIRKEQLPDEILSFLGHELFQIPVRQFMDDNCLSKNPFSLDLDQQKCAATSINKIFSTSPFDNSQKLKSIAKITSGVQYLQKCTAVTFHKCGNQRHRKFIVSLMFSVFDKQIPVADDHKKVHSVYRKLVSENISHERLHTFCIFAKK